MSEHYEISVWEDVYTGTSGAYGGQYPEEKKICVIGADGMTSKSRAFNPKFETKIDGTHTLTFSMYYIYYEEGSGEKVVNPFLSLLVNERKIKLHWRDQWYDFLIKKISEDSSKKSITYTCTDLFINELSKNGFNLEFDNELGNNTGTAADLAGAILDGTDWSYVEGETLVEQAEEAVYEVTTLYAFNATLQQSGDTVNVPSGSKILVYYSQVRDALGGTTGDKTIQFYWATSNTYQHEQSNQLVINGNCYSAAGRYSAGNDAIQFVIGSNNIFQILKTQTVSTNYRAKRLVTNYKQVFDNRLNRYVYEYTESNRTVYGYPATSYKDASILQNAIVNGSNFASFSGWTESTAKAGGLYWTLYPLYTSDKTISQYEAKSYLRLKVSGSDNWIQNSCFTTSQVFADGIVKGAKYVFRVRAFAETDSGPSGTSTLYNVVPSVKKVNDVNVITFERKSSEDDEYLYYYGTAQQTLTHAQVLSNDIRLILTASSTCWIEDVQLYNYVENGSGTRIDYGDFSTEGLVATEWKWYDSLTAAKKAEDITYIHISAQDDFGTHELQSNKFEKVRSITQKESNRFNLLQTLAETFEGWARFNIAHDATGHITYSEEDGKWKPNKTVTIIPEIGKETGLSLVYGLDLKSMTRSVDSDKIVTKTIVKANANEFGENGFCTIARSPNNYLLNNVIYNFDYYISQGLLDSNYLNRDLYLTVGEEPLKYFFTLHTNNAQSQLLDDEYIQIQKNLTNQQALLKVQQDNLNALTESSTGLASQICQLAGIASVNKASAYLAAHPDNKDVRSKLEAYQNNQNSITFASAQISGLQTSINNLNTRLESINTQKESCATAIQEVEDKFFTKYGRFIQEGSWISEDYYDDNLYYLDALSVAYESSRPQISYNINAFRISSLEEFQTREFNLGDICSVQDTEFFGYEYHNGIKTPYREKTLISEITYNFDEPSKDTFKVQNYHTQFEDLFQRITATTQSLQYATGSYKKVASIIEPDGTISEHTMQASLTMNQNLVYSATNESITQDATGTTYVDLNNPSQMSKMTSSGVFISTDGGLTWKNAIRGEGIATQYLTSGNITTDNITIQDHDFTSFRWDTSGLNAYYQIINGDGELDGINFSKFVRFDYNGIYGISNASAQASETFDPRDYAEHGYSTAEAYIWDTAKFGMTWDGFFVKNKRGGHTVEVSSTNDIRILETPTGSNPFERIKIGLLNPNSDEESQIYGIRITDGSGNPVMVTGSDGELWLQKTLTVGDGTTSTVKIGYDPDYYRQSNDTFGTQYHEVIHAGTRNSDTEFIVYEDGYMKASGATFTGTIYATGGKIGNMTINDVEEATYKVVITSDAGTVFKNRTGSKTLTATLMKGNTAVEPSETIQLSYQWKKGSTTLVGATDPELTVLGTDIDETTNFGVYTCEITYTEATNNA